MTSTPKKSTEAEDVLEFLNSLPENAKKIGDSSKFKAKANKNGKNDDNDNDILEFLDELEKSDIKIKKNPKKDEKSNKSIKSDESIPKESTKKESNEVIEETKEKQQQQDKSEEEEQQEEEDFVDPITSISNWWSSSGSQTVNSFWNNAVTITNKASEEATKFAQIDEIESRIKSLKIDDQAKKLIDSSRNAVIRDPLNLKNLSNNISNVLQSLNHIDEVITIYLIHDLINFSNLNDIILTNFKKVLKQVQGNIDVKIIKQNTANNSEVQFKKFNLFEGKLTDGEKLAFVNLESSIQSIESNKEEKEVGNTKLFISVLPIRQVSKNEENEEIETIDQNSSNSFNFTIILKDITHDINIISRSQSFPMKWVKWLEGIDDKKEKKEESKEGEEEGEEEDDDEVDPSEWVKEWIDDGLALTVGVLAQSYVVKRMGY